MEPMNQHDALDRLRELKSKVLLGGGEKRIEEQHAKGKLTARERLSILLDPDTFVEIDALVEHRSSDFGLDRQKSRAMAW